MIVVSDSSLAFSTENYETALLVSCDIVGVHGTSTRTPSRTRYQIECVTGTSFLGVSVWDSSYCYHSECDTGQICFSVTSYI
jgi:hypothetical protein